MRRSYDRKPQSSCAAHGSVELYQQFALMVPVSTLNGNRQPFARARPHLDRSAGKFTAAAAAARETAEPVVTISSERISRSIDKSSFAFRELFTFRALRINANREQSKSLHSPDSANYGARTRAVSYGFGSRRERDGRKCQAKRNHTIVSHRCLPRFIGKMLN